MKTRRRDARKVAGLRVVRSVSVALLLTWGGMGGRLWGEAVYLSIGTNTGANGDLNSKSSYIYNFGVTTAGGNAGLVLQDVLLTVRKSNGASAPVVITLYDGFGGQGNALTSGSLATTAFDATNYATVDLKFASAKTLAAGAYSIKVASACSGSGSDTYSLKTDTLYLSTSSVSVLGNLVVGSNWVQDSNGSGSASTSIVPAGGYVLADCKLESGQVDFGNYRVGTQLESRSRKTEPVS